MNRNVKKQCQRTDHEFSNVWDRFQDRNVWLRNAFGYLSRRFIISLRKSITCKVDPPAILTGAKDFFEVQWVNIKIQNGEFIS